MRNVPYCVLVKDIPGPVLQFAYKQGDKYCNKAKYLGVTLRSSVKFAVDLSCMKAKFYKSFNSLFHKAGKFIVMS